MKKIYALILLAVAIPSFSQTTAIPNSEFEQALIDLGYDSGPINGSVPTANISGVTELAVEFLGEITGIEDFTSLETFMLYNYSIQNVDLSQNTALTNLTLSVSGSGLSVNLAQNTALTTLDFYSNTVNNLDLSHNTSLTTLTLGSGYFGSNIYQYDISALTALTNFTLYANVTEIDVSQNTALQKLDIRTFDAPLSPLDLSANTLLTELRVDAPIANATFLAGHPLLETLFIKSGNLASFDGSIAPSLKSLELRCDALGPITLNNNTLLETLIVDSAVMNTIDVTNNTALEFLSLRGPITAHDLSQNTALKTLAISRSHATSLDLSHNTAVENFYFYSGINMPTIDLTAQTALVFVDMLNNAQLASVDLRNGNNENAVFMSFNSNPVLTCVYVDDKSAGYMGDTFIWRDFPGEYVDDEAECALSAPDHNTDLFAITPNPATDMLYVTNTQPISTITVTDTTGKKIIELKDVDRFDVSGLPEGLYLVRITAGGKTATKKFVKL